MLRFLIFLWFGLGSIPLFGKTSEMDWYRPLPPLTWNDAPLRPTLTAWCHEEKIPLMVDCRVDPNTLLTGTFRHATRITILQDVLQNASTEEKPLQLTQLEGILYVGPAHYASKLQTLSAMLHEQVLSFSPAKQKIWLKKAPLRWENRAAPRDILQELARKNRLKFSQTRLIPHDLWVAADLPSLDLVDRLILVLGQLGLTFTIDENQPNQIQLLPMDEKTLFLEKTYPLSPPLKEKLTVIRKTFPETQIRTSRKQARVRGIQEVHAFLASDKTLCCVGAFRQGKSGSPHAVGVDRKWLRISGKVSGSFLPLLQQFCEQHGYELEYDTDDLSDAGISLEQRITLEVQEVTPDEFLRCFAEAAGCRITIEKNRVRLLVP